ncbi:DUF2125 domain-containing protein [Inquilinus limosus]
MRWSLCLAFGLGVLAAASGPACAAQATAEEAAKLKAVLEAWQPSGTQLSPAESAFFTSRLPVSLPIGKWRVEPKGDEYQIEIPGIRRPMSELFEPLLGRTLLFCPADRINARRTPAGTYALSAEDSYGCRLEWDDGTVSRFVSRSRRVSGTVDVTAPATASMDIVFDRVTLERGADPIAQQAFPASPRPTIDRLILSGGRRTVSNDRADLRSIITLEGFSAPAPSGLGTITAKKIVYDIEGKGMDMAALAGAAVGLARRLAGDKVKKTDDDPVTQALLDRFVDGIGSGQHELVSVEGMTAKTASLTVGIGSLSAGVAIVQKDPDAARMTMRLDTTDITVDHRSPYADWIPTKGVIQLSLDDMPFRQILTSSILHGREDPDADTRSMQAAHTRIGIDRVHFEAPAASLELSGTTMLDPDAVLGQTGTLRMRLTGIDGLVKALQADPQASQAAAGLSVLQVLGRQTTLPDGRSARDYDIVIDPSGKVLVNGADVQALVPKDL